MVGREGFGDREGDLWMGLGVWRVGERVLGLIGYFYKQRKSVTFFKEYVTILPTHST